MQTNDILRLNKINVQTTVRIARTLAVRLTRGRRRVARLRRNNESWQKLSVNIQNTTTRVHDFRAVSFNFVCDKFRFLLLSCSIHNELRMPFPAYNISSCLMSVSCAFSLIRSYTIGRFENYVSQPQCPYSSCWIPIIFQVTVRNLLSLFIYSTKIRLPE